MADEQRRLVCHACAGARRSAWCPVCDPDPDVCALRARLAAAEAVVAAAAPVRESLEYETTADGDPRCAVCGMSWRADDDEIHRPDCEVVALDAALAQHAATRAP